MPVQGFAIGGIAQGALTSGRLGTLGPDATDGTKIGITEATVAGQECHGMIIEGGADGVNCTLQMGGYCVGIAGAAVAIGEELQSDADGKVTPAATGDWVAGIALSKATADGDVVEMFLIPRVPYDA